MAMDIEYDDEIIKPEKWPANQRERRLQLIYDATEALLEQPSHVNKEVLFSLLTPVDINEMGGMGLVRITDYEVSLINSLYLYSVGTNLSGLRFYLYYHIYLTVLSLRMVEQMPFYSSQSGLFDPLLHLVPELEMFFITYYNYRSEKKREFADAIINDINEALKYMEREDQIEDLCHSYINMLYTLSFLPDRNVFPVVAFSRNDLRKLFSLCSILLKKTDSNILKSPLKGVMCITISNWILNSRNNYNAGYLLKYMDEATVNIALDNEEIWMRETDTLNDKREGVLIRELLKNKKWIKYEWAKKVALKQRKDTFVSSFSKCRPRKELTDRYGSNYFGYKNDRIGELLSPIFQFGPVGVFFGHVQQYDILYGKDNAKEELNYLFDIINLFAISEIEKSNFLNEIIQYWELSFKDNSWAAEEERRYEIIRLHGGEPIDMCFEDKFLKMRTSLFSFPDFVSENNVQKLRIRNNRIQKLKATQVNKILFCENCLNSEIITVGTTIKKCPQCGSSKLIQL